MAILETVRLSKNTSIQWLSLNPILADKEIGIETNTKLFKVGDGINHWQNLAYVLSGYQNALFISLSNEADNMIGLTTEGSLILHASAFNGLTDYQTGKEQGLAAPVPSKEYNYTILKIGQDIKSVLDNLTALSTRLTQQESKPLGDKIDDAAINMLSTWSADKIKDYVLTELLDLKNEITSNPDGAYDALTRLAQLLQDNTSLAVTITEELGTMVRFGVSQTLTQTQQDVARANIGAFASSDIGDTSTFAQVYTTALASSLNSPFESNEL